MCEWGDGVEVDVLAPGGPRTVWVDSCLAGLVGGLARSGEETTGCCCGHGDDCPTVLLGDGRTVYVLGARPWEWWRLAAWAVGRAFAMSWREARRIRR